MNPAKWITGALVDSFTGPLLRAYEMRLDAQNDASRLEAEAVIQRIETARDIALAEARDRWSATRLGRILIVVPYGLWWSAIYGVQMLNPWIVEPLFGVTLIVRDVPPHINEMAKILVPAIVLGDAFMFAKRSKA